MDSNYKILGEINCKWHILNFMDSVEPKYPHSIQMFLNEDDSLWWQSSLGSFAHMALPSSVYVYQVFPWDNLQSTKSSSELHLVRWASFWQAEAERLLVRHLRLCHELLNHRTIISEKNEVIVGWGHSGDPEKYRSSSFPKDVANRDTIPTVVGRGCGQMALLLKTHLFIVKRNFHLKVYNLFSK